MAIKKKKIPYYLLLFLLTIGAIGIIGLLSFTGMFTLVPLVSLAAISFVLSVVYEGEIYLQNIKGAFNKLTKHKNTEHQLANAYLYKMFENNTINTKAEDCPKFFKDYEKQLKLLHKFSHKRLDEESEKRKRKLEKTLKDMEKWFANQLYSRNKSTTYELELHDWLIKNGQAEEIKLLRDRKTTYNGIKMFSVVCGAFMSLGVGYLLVEAIMVLAGIATLTAATLPGVIIPLALVAGAAYTFLIYNSITDMIHNDSLRKWFYQIKKELSEGITCRKVFVAVSAGVLFLLALALTFCTCGTWWSIAKAAGMPSFFSGLLATMLGGSTLIFNLENTSESLEMINDAATSEKGFFTQLGEGLVKIYHRVRDQIDNENWLQLLNPFRLIILFTVTPLRLILFAGHLISIGVTADRVPGIPEIVSAILGIISEGFEDFHYFIGDLLPHKHGHSTKELLKERLGGSHSHNHANDIPTRMIHFCFLPFFAAATAFDWLATRLVSKEPEPCERIWHSSDRELSFEEIGDIRSNKNAVVLYKNELYYAHHRSQNIKKIKLCEDNREAYETLRDNFLGSKKSDNSELIQSLTGRHGKNKPLSWNEAWDKHRGLPPIESVKIKESAPKPSKDWQFEQTIHRVDTHIEKHLEKVSVNPEIAKEKVVSLRELKKDLCKMQGKPMDEVRARIAAEAKKPVYGKQRFFAQEGSTATEDFLHDLPERISAPAA